MVKNLVSYLYLSDPNDLEKSLGINLKCMNTYYQIFDGIKIIYVSTDVEIDDDLKNKISERLGSKVFKFVRNNSNNRESEHFIDQLKDLRSLMEDGSMTFYHHSKGVTYNNPNVDKWAASMYFFNLCDDNLKNIELELSNDKIFAGIFRVDHPCPPWVYSDWHFSGTFFWFSSKLFEIHDWDKIEIERFSIESYPGNKIPIERSYNIDDIINCGCDLRYTYYWNNFFPTLINSDKLNDFFNLLKDDRKEKYRSEISYQPSAWSGHFDFAIDLIKLLNPKMTVELGVDWGFSMFSFAYPKIGEVYGIDWFQGDQHAGLRDTKEYVLDLYDKLKPYGIEVNIIKGDFTDMSKIWSRSIDILHIDGLHTYEAVEQDFNNWSKFLNYNGVVLFHDVESFEEVRRFFSSLSGYKLIRSGSNGLGVWTNDLETYEKLKTLV